MTKSPINRPYVHYDRVLLCSISAEQGLDYLTLRAAAYLHKAADSYKLFITKRHKNKCNVHLRTYFRTYEHKKNSIWQVNWVWKKLFKQYFFSRVSRTLLPAVPLRNSTTSLLTFLPHAVCTCLNWDYFTSIYQYSLVEILFLFTQIFMNVFALYPIFWPKHMHHNWTSTLKRTLTNLTSAQPAHQSGPHFWAYCGCRVGPK